MEHQQMEHQEMEHQEMEHQEMERQEMEHQQTEHQEMEPQHAAIAIHLLRLDVVRHRIGEFPKINSENKVIWNEVNVADRSAMFFHINFETVLNLFETIELIINL